MGKLYINKSPAPQILTLGSSPFGITIRQNEVFGREQTDLPIERLGCFEKYEIKSLHDVDEVTLVREYALGDLIQLIPVARAFKNHYNIKKLNIATSPRFIELLKKMFCDLNFYLNSNSPSRDVYHKIHLNGILENDHSLCNSQRNYHRVEIYSNFLEMDLSDHVLDWGMKMKNKDDFKMFFDESDEVIALQIRGSGILKTLPYPFIKKIATAITEMGYKVLLIDQDKDMGFEGENIINACGKMTVIDIVKNLEKCKCVLTMDSGVLWLAHVANCPVLTFLGSTRESERISLHPQYPEKAKSINLADAVGCIPCFETRVRCKGAIHCMNKFDHVTILNQVRENLNSILKGGHYGQEEKSSCG